MYSISMIIDKKMAAVIIIVVAVTVFSHTVLNHERRDSPPIGITRIGTGHL